MSAGRFGQYDKLFLFQIAETTIDRYLCRLSSGFRFSAALTESLQKAILILFQVFFRPKTINIHNDYRVCCCKVVRTGCSRLSIRVRMSPGAPRSLAGLRRRREEWLPRSALVCSLAARARRLQAPHYDGVGSPLKGRCVKFQCCFARL